MKKTPYIFNILFLSFSILFSATISANETFTQYIATYQLNWRGVSAGSSQHELKKLEPNLWVAEVVSKPYLSIIPFGNSERSEFSIEDSSIKPERYDFMTEEKGKTIIGFVDFDWANHSLLKSVQDGGERNEPLTEGVQDRITYNLQLRLDLLNGKKDLTYTVIEPKKVKHYTFNIVGEEKITTPLGTFDTVKLETVNEKGDRRTHVWLAKEFDYLLIKLEQYKNDVLESEAILKTLKVIAPKGSAQKGENVKESHDHEHSKNAPRKTETIDELPDIFKNGVTEGQTKMKSDSREHHREAQ